MSTRVMDPQVTLQQIGLDARLAVSARDAISGHNGQLTFRFGIAGGARRYITIDLDANDTYRVTVKRVPVRGKNKWIAETLDVHTDIYFDDLPGLVREINHKHGS